MPTYQEELHAAGIWATRDERSAPRVECARLAGHLRARRVRAVGLLPAGEDVAVPAVALELGLALAQRCAGPVAVVDAHGSWPGVRELAEATPPSRLAACWLVENLAAITLHAVKAGARLRRLRAVVVDGAAAFAHVVVDLTGLDREGEQLEAIELLDGVAVVARSGRTTTREVQRRLRDVQPERRLGVLLTGL